jgi:hypothetical protein
MTEQRVMVTSNQIKRMVEEEWNSEKRISLCFEDQDEHSRTKHAAGVEPATFRQIRRDALPLSYACALAIKFSQCTKMKPKDSF